MSGTQSLQLEALPPGWSPRRPRSLLRPGGSGRARNGPEIPHLPHRGIWSEWSCLLVFRA